MKKNTKILVFVLSLALLIGAAISVSATEETPAPEIMAKNVIYGADIRFQFAVDATAYGEGETVTIKIYDANPAGEAALLDTVNATYTNVTDTNLGVDYAYIASSKVAVSAIAFGQEFWAVAECDGVQGKAIKYSAVEYFLERLYADADKITDIQKAHYENAIAYGSTAQKVTGDTKTNVADYIYVMAKDGTVNGAEGAIALKGEALNFTYTGTEDASGLAYWLDPNGYKTAVASVSGIYAPKFADFTFSDLSNDTAITLSTSSGFKVASLADGDKDISKYAGLIYSYPPSSGRDQAFSIVDGTLKHTSTTGGVEFGLYNAKNYEANSNYTNFESDVTLVVPEGKAEKTLTTQFRLNTSNERYRVVLTYNTNGKLFIKFQIRNYWGSGYFTLSDTAVQVAENGSLTAEFNLRFESVYIADTDDSALAVYVNGVARMIADSRAYEGDYSTIPANKDDLKPYMNTDGTYICKLGHMSPSLSDASLQDGVYRMIYFNPNSGCSGDICFDNIIFESKALSADEIPVYNITPKS